MKLFITSSGTGIGKTLVTAALTHQLRALGEPVTALKPIISGMNQGPLEDSDTGVLLRAMGRDVTVDNADVISPWRYAAPLSPDMAAALEGRTIDIEAVIKFSREPHPGHVLIEGVGGAMVPLGSIFTTMDWMTVMRWGTWVVVGSYLGSLSHTLTTLEACRSRGVAVARIIVSETPDSTVSLEDTVDTLRRICEVEVTGLRRVEGVDPWKRLPPLV